MATKKSTSIDFSALKERMEAQFSGLNPNDPSTWPGLPKFLLCVVVTVGVAAALWFLVLKGEDEKLQAERVKEVGLRAEFTKKVALAVNLDALKVQREQVLQYVTQLEKQLPGKAEMDALLSDINNAGLGRSLAFDLFRPGSISVRAYYAELPISVRVTGRYHDIGSFASDVAHLSRIVTLNNLTITPSAAGVLSMTATARTFRYLDTEEVTAQGKAGVKK